MKALLDCGAQSSYLSASAMRRAGLTPQRRKQPYPLQVANGQPMPGEDQITHEVIRVPLQIQQHLEEIDLDVFEMATHDIILGLPWLRKHNPWIDWKNRCLSLTRCGCATTSKPAQRNKTLVDEKTINNIASTKRRFQERNSDSADTGRSPPGHEARGKETSAPPDIPREYAEWEHLFKEELTIEALPKHKP